MPTLLSEDSTSLTHSWRLDSAESTWIDYFPLLAELKQAVRRSFGLAGLGMVWGPQQLVLAQIESLAKWCQISLNHEVVVVGA